MSVLRASLFGAAMSLALSPAVASATPDGLALSGTFRLRGEAIAGQPRAGFNDEDQFLVSRLQARLTWTYGPWQVVGEVHDSRTAGVDKGSPLSTFDVNTLEPMQAYVRWSGPVGQGAALAVMAGRMTMELGSRRLIANDDYRNTTNGFTGIRADLTATRGWHATGVYLLPLQRLPEDLPALRSGRAELDRESFDTVLWGGLLTRQHKGSPFLAEVEYLHFGERDSPGHPSRDRSLDTVNLRVARETLPAHVDWSVEGMHQWGRAAAAATPGAARLPVSAWFGRASLGYAWATPWHPHVLAEFDYASGDGPGGRYGRFDTLYGLRRADLGPAGLYTAIVRSNILSPGIRIEVAPGKRFDAFVGYRAFWLADRHDSFASTGVRDATGRSGRFAGHQIDMRLRQWLVPQKLRAEVDAVYLARGRFLETAPNGRADDTRYIAAGATVSF